MSGPPAIIWKDQVEKLLRYEDLIPRVESALSLYSRRDGGVIQPVRTTVALRKHHGFLGLMPAYMEQEGVLSTKAVCFYQREQGSNLPAMQATLLLFDPEQGSVTAVMDGEVITAMRTAAASVISAKLLMPANAKVLAILGTGAQALSHYHAFMETFSFTEVRVWSTSKQSTERFSCLVGGAVITFSSVEEAVAGADVIVTVTRETEPVLFGRWVKPGAHVAAVGACRPTWRELDDQLMGVAMLYVDSREGALSEAGDVILSGAEVFAEIGEVLNGSRPAHRERTTVFKSLGLGVEDAVAAKLVLDQWKAKGGVA